MYQNAYQKDEYRQQDVVAASPIHLVVMAYDVAIRACEQKDFAKATKTIGIMRDALNFDCPEVSMGLFRLYEWCLDNIRQGDYMAALTTLRELRSAWRTAEQHASTIAVPVPVRASTAGAFA
jgi:flagellar secretion chaperone FliS